MENTYLEKLKNTQEIIPEKYDGSYELVKETIKQYRYISLENVSFTDIDLIYFMTVGTWAYGIDKRKELIENSALDQPKKEYLNKLIDEIWNNAQNEMYIHKEFEDKICIGMFGTGFGTFKGSCDIDTIKRYIALIVNVYKMVVEDTIKVEDDIFNYVEQELQNEYKGIGIASFSQVLHCLNPYMFPIINGNQGIGITIYSKLGIEIDKKITPQNYIKNVRRIREFRNNNFSWKNYRIIDLLSVEEDKWLNSLGYSKLDELIKSYKDEHNKFYLDELYKWEAIKTFQDNWDVDAENFSEMLELSLKDSDNLLSAKYYYPKSMILQFSQKEPETVREMFRMLFDENLDLKERVDNFQKNSEIILNKYWGEKNNDYQDTHVISTYLTFRYPEKYYIYKTSVDKCAAKKINVDISDNDKVAELIKFFKLCDKILEYIKKDDELLRLSQNSLDDKCYSDLEYHVLVFDLLFYIGARYRGQKIWLYTPGEKAIYWNECIKNSIMILGWDDIGDYRQYNLKQEIKDVLNNVNSIQDEAKRKKGDISIWNFKQEMQQGDIVYVRKGLGKIIGMGVVKSDYNYDNSREYFKNVRDVNWEVFECEKDYKLPGNYRDTLIDITEKSNLIQDFKNLLSGENDMNNIEKNIINKSNWIFPANPSRYDHELAFKENGFIEWEQNVKCNIGDVVYIYVSAPEGKIRYKTEVEKINIPFFDLEIKKNYWKIDDKDSEDVLYAKLKLIDSIYSEDLSFKKLRENGLLSTLTSGEKIDSKPNLLKYIENIFNKKNKNNYSEKQLGEILNTYYNDSSNNKVTGIYLFGINYGEIIKNKNLNRKNIILESGIPISYRSELDKAIDLGAHIEKINSIKNVGFIVDDRITGGINKIYYGAPGCGKSFHITKTFCTEDNIYFRTTFHPDYTNGDFIGQIIPKLKDNQVFYDIQEGPFSKALAEAIKNPDKKVCLIIEEINRGNASAIFGDVFQLLDRDKTGKSIFEINNYIIQEYLRREEITEIDGQKIDKIFIPSNLWILATMNTSDQNVFTLDTAFKRRWQLEKIKNIFKFEDKYENEADVEYDKKLAAMLVPGTDWTWKKFVYWINDNIVKKDTFSVNGEDKQIGVYFVKEDELWESTSEMDDKEERKKRFAEKVLMYLWEDVTRLNRDSWFGNEYRTLDQLINAFNDSKIRLNIFKDIAVENSTIVATNSESSDENE